MKIEIKGNKRGKLFPRYTFWASTVNKEVRDDGRNMTSGENAIVQGELKKNLGLGEVSLSKKGDLIKLKMRSGESHLCEKIYADGEIDSLDEPITAYFQDYSTKKYFFVRENDIAGPYKAMHMLKDGTYEAIDDENNVYLLRKEEIRPYKTITRYKYVSPDVVVNEAGKYAGIEDGKLTTVFIFDEPPVNPIAYSNQIWGDYFRLTIDKDRLYLHDKWGDVKTLSVDNFGNEVTNIEEKNNILVVSSKYKTLIINLKDFEVVYKIDEEYNASFKYGDTLLGFNDKCVQYYYDEKENTYKLNELPYAIESRSRFLSTRNYVVAINKEGKRGIVTMDGNIAVNFDDYDSITLGGESFFVPIMKDNKLEIYDLTLGQMITKEPLDPSIKIKSLDVDIIKLVDSRDNTEYTIYKDNDTHIGKVEVRECGPKQNKELFNCGEDIFYKFLPCMNKKKISSY